MRNQPGLVSGLIGGVIVVIASWVLSLQQALPPGLLVFAAVFPLLILIIAALIAGRQAQLVGQNVTVNGAILGILMTVAVLVGNILITASPTYEQIVSNLPGGSGDLQITAFELSPGSILSTLLVNVLVATGVSALAGRFLVPGQRR